MKCNEVKILLSELMDGELSAGVKESVNIHLKKCGACAATFALLRRTAEELKTIPDEEVPEQFYSGLDRKLASAERPLLLRFAGIFTPSNIAVLASGLIAGAFIGALLVGSYLNTGRSIMTGAAKQGERKIVLSTGDLAAAGAKIAELKKKYETTGVSAAVQEKGDLILPKKYLVVLDEGRYDDFLNELHNVGAVKNRSPEAGRVSYPYSMNARQTRIELELEEEIIGGRTIEGGQNNEHNR